MTASLWVLLTFLIPYTLIYFRLPYYMAEAIWMLSLNRFAGTSQERRLHFARWLPFRHHDLIHFPLPGLRPFFVALSETDPRLTQKLIAEAAASIGQKGPARRALAEIQARELEHAARNRLFASVAKRDLVFLPRSQEGSDAFTPFQLAARDLQAARTSRNHHHRRKALDLSERSLRDGQGKIVARRKSDLIEQRLLPVYRLWLDVIRDEQATLTQEEQRRPQVPVPFVAGPVLEAEDSDLFKGRKHLIQIIDHDLTGDRRAPLLLLGQRRMGKSSLLNMLPVQLGTGTAVVRLTFQRISGSSFRDRPHSWVAQEVAALRPSAPPPPPVEAPWNEVLSWLSKVDASLRQEDRRILVAIDEVERLEDDIRDGRGTPQFLDFVRSAGDSLRSLRFLLASAYPLPRLGPHWVDRLISVLVRHLEPLDEEAARDLILRPMQGFPNIYPAGGVERILTRTARHPYLIQFVCDTLCRRLNEIGRLKANDDDLERAFDRSIEETTLFYELWRERTDDERKALRTLAESGGVEGLDRSLLRSLEREGYVTLRDERWAITVPMFATWIATKL